MVTPVVSIGEEEIVQLCVAVCNGSLKISSTDLNERWFNFCCGVEH
jgi:hypothetical protein